MMLRSIRSIAKKLVSEHYPEELKFFDLFWESFKDLIIKWKDKHPKDWPLKTDFQPKLMESLGLESGLDLLTPSIIAVIAASAYHLGTLKKKARTKKITEIVESYTNRFLRESKREEKTKIKNHIGALLEVEAPRLTPIKRAPKALKQFEVITADGPTRFNKAELDEFMKANTAENFFIWVNDIQDEIWLDRKREEVTLSLHSKALLTLLLQNCNKTVDYVKLYNYVVTETSKLKPPEDRPATIRYLELAPIEKIRKWKHRLNTQTKKLLHCYIVSIPGKGYKFKGKVNFCVIRLYEK